MSESFAVIKPCEGGGFNWKASIYNKPGDEESTFGDVDSNIFAWRWTARWWAKRALRRHRRLVATAHMQRPLEVIR